MLEQGEDAQRELVGRGVQARAKHGEADVTSSVSVMFLEHAEDDEIEPDAAVRGIEAIGHELNALSPAVRAEFRLVLERIAETSGDSGQAQQARDVPFMLWVSGNHAARP